jgi:ABC-type antimicrobial peptide transport system permease subunit
MIVNPLQKDLTSCVRPALFAVLGAVFLVMLIACVNVANLLLARGAQRRAEFALRAALGAARGRVVRQLLTETILLATIGAILGIVVAAAALRALIALSPPGLPQVHAMTIDPAALLFALATAAIIGIILGLVPAFQLSREELNTGCVRPRAQPPARASGPDALSSFQKSPSPPCSSSAPACFSAV